MHHSLPMLPPRPALAYRLLLLATVVLLTLGLLALGLRPGSARAGEEAEADAAPAEAAADPAPVNALVQAMGAAFQEGLPGSRALLVGERKLDGKSLIEPKPRGLVNKPDNSIIRPQSPKGGVGLRYMHMWWQREAKKPSDELRWHNGALKDTLEGWQKENAPVLAAAAEAAKTGLQLRKAVADWTAVPEGVTLYPEKKTWPQFCLHRFTKACAEGNLAAAKAWAREVESATYAWADAHAWLAFLGQNQLYAISYLNGTAGLFAQCDKLYAGKYKNNIHNGRFPIGEMTLHTADNYLELERIGELLHQVPPAWVEAAEAAATTGGGAGGSTEKDAALAAITRKEAPLPEKIEAGRKMLAKVYAKEIATTKPADAAAFATALLAETAASEGKMVKQYVLLEQAAKSAAISADDLLLDKALARWRAHFDIDPMQARLEALLAAAEAAGRFDKDRQATLCAGLLDLVDPLLATRAFPEAQRAIEAAAKAQRRSRDKSLAPRVQDASARHHQAMKNPGKDGATRATSAAGPAEDGTWMMPPDVRGLYTTMRGALSPHNRRNLDRAARTPLDRSYLANMLWRAQATKADESLLTVVQRFDEKFPKARQDQLLDVLQYRFEWFAGMEWPDRFDSRILEWGADIEGDPEAAITAAHRKTNDHYGGQQNYTGLVLTMRAALNTNKMDCIRATDLIAATYAGAGYPGYRMVRMARGGSGHTIAGAEVEKGKIVIRDGLIKNGAPKLWPDGYKGATGKMGAYAVEVYARGLDSLIFLEGFIVAGPNANTLVKAPVPYLPGYEKPAQGKIE